MQEGCSLWTGLSVLSQAGAPGHEHQGAGRAGDAGELPGG